MLVTASGQTRGILSGRARTRHLWQHAKAAVYTPTIIMPVEQRYYRQADVPSVSYGPKTDLAVQPAQSKNRNATMFARRRR